MLHHDLEERVAERTAELAQANAALAFANVQYLFLADAMPVTVWMSRPDGFLDYFNRCWCDYTGLTFEQSLDRGWLDVIHPDDRDHYLELWAHSCANEEEFTIECRFRRASDGSYLWHLGRAIPQRDTTGRVVQWIGFYTEIDAYKRAVAGMEVANKELEAFAYSVSHDLRAPLRAINGFARMLEKEHAPVLAPEAQHFLKRIQANTEKMGNLIDDLLAFSRLGRQSIRRQEISTRDLVNEIWNDLSVDLEGRQFTFVLGELADCVADRTLLNQIFTNLLDNAIKYTRHRAVTVIEVGGSVDALGNEVVYWVKDNGVGFDMRYADKIFGVFQRLERDEDYEGTGVGLAVVQRIVHRFGGRVWANGDIDAGSTFSFALPHNVPRLGHGEITANTEHEVETT